MSPLAKRRILGLSSAERLPVSIAVRGGALVDVDHRLNQRLPDGRSLGLGERSEAIFWRATTIHAAFHLRSFQRAVLARARPGLRARRAPVRAPMARRRGSRSARPRRSLRRLCPRCPSGRVARRPAARPRRSPPTSRARAGASPPAARRQHWYRLREKTFRFEPKL
jgi:hypothetical protein